MKNKQEKKIKSEMKKRDGNISLCQERVFNTSVPSMSQQTLN